MANTEETPSLASEMFCIALCASVVFLFVSALAQAAGMHTWVCRGVAIFAVLRYLHAEYADVQQQCLRTRRQCAGPSKTLYNH